jgi:cupin 2 domain-containing protein
VTFKIKNVFSELEPGANVREEIITLFEKWSVKIERIVSHQHNSPPGFWYDQAGDEWVIVLRGNATLEFDGGEFVEMNAGDYLEISRHVKHRIARTDEETVWLAVHIK